jgi:hypothetical protein
LLILVLLVLRQIDGKGGSLAIAWWFARLVHQKQTDHFFPRQHALAGRPAALFRAAVISAQKRKGPQLALEPLNGRGVAGYVPKP